MTLETLGELESDLGGLLLPQGPLNVIGDDGLEGIETATEDMELGMDGAAPGIQRIPGRPVSLYLSASPTNATDSVRAENMATAMHDLGQVIQPLPDRNRGVRVFRWRRRGEVAKRLYYRPAHGQALKIPGDDIRQVYDHADLEVHLDCLDPVIVSDEYEDHVFTPGETKTIINLGTLTALPPSLGWSLTAPGTVVLENLDFGERIGFIGAPGGPTTVSRRMEIRAGGGWASTYGKAYGPNWSPFRWPPLLRPGPNTIRASASCTLRTWSTW